MGGGPAAGAAVVDINRIADEIVVVASIMVATGEESLIADGGDRRAEAFPGECDRGAEESRDGRHARTRIQGFEGGYARGAVRGSVRVRWDDDRGVRGRLFGMVSEQRRRRIRGDG